MKKLILTLTVLALIVAAVLAERWPPKTTSFTSDRNGSFLRVGGTSNDTTAIFKMQSEEKYTDWAYILLGDSTGLTKAAGGAGADTIPDSVSVAILLYGTVDTTLPDTAASWLLVKGDTLTKGGQGKPRLVVGSTSVISFPYYRFVIDGQNAATNDSMNWSIKLYWSSKY